MENTFTSKQIDEIASKLIIKQQPCILIYLNLCFILIILYLLYNHTKYIKKNKKIVHNLQDKILKMENQKKNDTENFLSPDNDTRYLVVRSQKGVSNKNLLDTAGLEFYTNPDIEDSRLLNALNNL